MKTGPFAVWTGLLALACSSGSGPAADLPAGWETAQAVQSFSQASCSGSADVPDAPGEAMEVSVAGRSIVVGYHHAHFRCEQAVSGFVRIGSKAVDFLVQPTDMNPSRVAQCDCLYEVSLTEPVSPGSLTVSVYRRWDLLGSTRSDPVLVGSADVVVH